METSTSGKHGFASPSKPRKLEPMITAIPASRMQNSQTFMPTLLRALISASFLAALVLAFCSKTSSARDRPNVLFLFADDQDHDTIHALGNKDIRTPSIDRLVKSGVTFESAYIMGGSSPAVCSPSRAALFSGRTLWNIPCQSLWGFEIPKEIKTLPQVFRESGYATFATGKNEPGKHGHFARSFSHADKILFKGMTRSQYKLQLHEFDPEGKYASQKPTKVEGKHSAEVYADACIEFLNSRNDAKEPFFAYVAFQTPHDPRQCPEEFRSMYKDEEMKLPASFLPEHPFDNGMLKIRDEKLAKFPRTEEVIRKHRADYYATITHTDAQIGRILDALEESGKADNTIVVFTADNGIAIGRHGLMGKQNVYDHGVHVPMIVSGPGIPKDQRRDQLCYIYDINPTLCELAGLEIPKTVQYKSLGDVIKNPQSDHREYLSFGFMSWQRAVQNSRYKLIEYCVEGKRHTQLFDLSKDPNEMKNLAEEVDMAPILTQLRVQLQKEKALGNDGNTPYPFSNQMGIDFWTAYEKSGNEPSP